MLDVWIYRDGRRRVRTSDLVACLARERTATGALVVCGELEAALADAGLELPSIADVTDAYARLALGFGLGVPSLQPSGWPETLVVGTPEGFAYDGLHPHVVAQAMRDVPGGEVLVVGVRSIGTTLAAVARAALERRGVRAERETVRPSGSASARALASVHFERRFDTVVVIDEGPGLSGSTLLALAEAYERAGAPRVIIVCTRAPSALPPAHERRWRRFRTIVADAPGPGPRGEDIGGGRWRDVHRVPGAPAYPAFERRKILVRDRVWKQEGFGSAAQAAVERAHVLSGEGITLPAATERNGWLSTPWTGHPLRARDLDDAIVEKIVRSSVVRTRVPATPTEPLRPVIAKNARVLFGADESSVPALEVVAPAIVDGRLAPHEWVRDEGHVYKTDALSHGDDHFFPGPTDIAWDLAGAIVEWDMDAAKQARLLQRYRAASGDDATARIADWLYAYRVQRAAFAAFAAA